MRPRVATVAPTQLRAVRVCFDDHMRPVFVREAFENTRVEEPPLRLLRISDRVKLEEDEDMVRIVDSAEYALNRRLLPGVWSILVEHRPPFLVVADLNPGDDERRNRPLLGFGNGCRSEPSLLRVLHCPTLPNHGDLDLSGVLELALDLARDLVREQRRLVVSDLRGLHDHPDLPPGLERVDPVHAGLGARQLLERFESFDVSLQALAPCARTRS